MKSDLIVIRRQLLKLAGSVLLLAGLTGTAYASRIHFPNLDLKQGFDFKKDYQVPFGFITNLKVGAVTLKNDIKAKDPATGADVPVTGVLSSFSWNGGSTDQLEFHMHVSQNNQQLINGLLRDKMLNPNVMVTFVIFKYDAHSKKYFQAIFTGSALNGILATDNGNLSMAVSPEAHPLVQSPMNYHAIMHIKPAPMNQEFGLAVGDGKTMKTQWGVAAK
ncbi:MAG: hypothetical protein WCK94_03375 [Comamonadaceae bacterium]|jgi:hypothetical protein